MLMLEDDKDAAARQLIEWHFQVEPGLVVVYRVLDEDESDPREPIKLVEVNRDTVATDRFEPYRFAPTREMPFATLIAEVTPDELERLRRTPGAIPESWNLDQAEKFQRPGT